MKKHIYSLGLVSLFMSFLVIQSFGQTGFRNKVFKNESQTIQKIKGNESNATNSGSNPGNSTAAIWDVRFTIDPVELSGYNALAGVCYAKGYFFFSKWNGADTVVICDSAGEFVEAKKITNAGAIRSMTFDGTFIYAGNNTRNVQVINPVTRTRVRQFSVPASVGNVRWITFNPAGNNGLGSFYVGNFDTDIFQINKPTGTNAAVLNSIPAATHGLTGMYGASFQSDGANSKLWVFDQSQAASQAVIVQLTAAGIATGITKDVDEDAPAGAGGLAGGLNLADVPGYPGKTLLAMSQGGGMVAYDVSAPVFDASFDSLGVTNNLAAWPKKWDASVTVGGKVKSIGESTLANFTPKIDIIDGDTEGLIETLQIPSLTLGSGQSSIVQSSPLVNGLYSAGGFYVANGITAYPGDENGSNDTAFVVFGITDSTVARDYAYFDNTIAGSIGIGAPASDEKGLGSKFLLPRADTLTSVSYYLATPFQDQTSSVSIYSVSETGEIGAAPITTTGTYTATAADEANGVLVTLALDNPLPLPAGQFFVAVNELGDSTCGIGNFAFNYIPNTFFVKWNSFGGGAWTDLQGFGGNLRRAFCIYPNFGRVPVVTTTLAVCTTSTITAITLTGATANNNIISDGGATVTERGVCWSTNPNPTIALTTKTVDGSGTGLFSSTIAGLDPNTMYYVRSYATNSVGTTYGNQLFFSTLSTNTIGTCTTAVVSNISTTSAVSGGQVLTDGGAPITAKGICWSTSANPTIALSTKTFNGTGLGGFVSTMNNLTPNTTYFVRSYAQNNVGVAYGEELQFTTLLVSVSKILDGGRNLNLLVYPNPNSGSFTANMFSEKGGKAEVRILNSIGQTVELSTVDVPAGESLIPFNVKSLKSGIYFFSVKMDGQIRTQNLIKE